MNISRGSVNQFVSNEKIRLTYFESNAFYPYDILVVDSKEHIIKAGLVVVIDKNSKCSVISKDIHSYRVF